MRPGLSAVFGLFLLASASPVQGDETKAKYEAAADYSAGLGGRALLVMVDGKVVYERYDRGWAAERPHPLASGTKSFSGVLAAAAIQDRIIESWDARVSDTIRPWQEDPLKRDITLRHLLSLSSGLDPADPALESLGGGAVLGEAAARRSERIAKSGVAQADDKHAAALAARLTGRPGQQFEYGAAHFYAFARLPRSPARRRGCPPEDGRGVFHRPHRGADGPEGRPLGPRQAWAREPARGDAAHGPRVGEAG